MTRKAAAKVDNSRSGAHLPTLSSCKVAEKWQGSFLTCEAVAAENSLADRLFWPEVNFTFTSTLWERPSQIHFSPLDYLRSGSLPSDEEPSSSRLQQSEEQLQYWSEGAYELTG